MSGFGICATHFDQRLPAPALWLRPGLDDVGLGDVGLSDNGLGDTNLGNTNLGNTGRGGAGCKVSRRCS